eukprot:3064003-Alexandrium_andersonii.AAC.1
MISKPAQRPTILLREAASRARTFTKSAPPRAELGAGGAALRAAPPGPRTEPWGCRFPQSSGLG